MKKLSSRTIESIEDYGVTSLFVLGDPITSAAKKIVDVLALHSTGIIYLQKKGNEENQLSTGVMSRLRTWVILRGSLNQYTVFFLEMVLVLNHKNLLHRDIIQMGNQL